MDGFLESILGATYYSNIGTLIRKVAQIRVVCLMSVIKSAIVANWSLWQKEGEVDVSNSVTCFYWTLYSSAMWLGVTPKMDIKMTCA